MSPSMSMSRMDMRERNSVGSSCCRSIRLRGMPSSSFHRGSQKGRLRVMGPSSLPRAALSRMALAMNSPTKWNFLRCEGVEDRGLMYSWLCCGPAAQNSSGEPREMELDREENHSRVTPPLSMPASPMKVTLSGWRHTAWPLPANTATLSLKQRVRRTSILCTGPSTASLATSSRNSLRRMRKSWRTQRRAASGPLLERGCSGSISISSTCSHDMDVEEPREPSLPSSSSMAGSSSDSTATTAPGCVHLSASCAKDTAHDCMAGVAGRRGVRLSRVLASSASLTADSRPSGPCSVSSCSSTMPKA
mmetsp:Transcript_6439/g.16018  ORF Transcript_6439/g.16018 Transcript_6439/m.16018 type:complete len:305 (-) Transcript_6439:201-1115(-)